MSRKKAFELGEYFEKIVVRKILEGDARFSYWLTYLKPEYFTVSHLRHFVRRIRRIRRKEGILPTRKILKQSIQQDEELTSKEKRFFQKALVALWKIRPKEAEELYALSELKKFIRKQEYLLAIEKSLEELERQRNGDVVTFLDNIFGKVLRLGDDSPSVQGLSYFETVRDRLLTKEQRIPHYRLLIPEIDCHLRNNGMQPGETVMWLAATGAGKTMALVHTAKAWLLQKLRGVYYTLQLQEEDIAERFDASFSGIPLTELAERGPEACRKLRKLGKRYGKSLIIKYFPRYKHSIQSLRNHLQLLKESDFHPQFIVIDFLNYLQPSAPTQKDAEGSRYFKGGDVVGEFIALCQEMKLLGAGGIQANRMAVNEDVTTIQHVAESFASVMEATLVISINRKAEERETEKARLFIAKYSFGKDMIVVPIHTNYEKGSLYRKL